MKLIWDILKCLFLRKCFFRCIFSLNFLLHIPTKLHKMVSNNTCTFSWIKMISLSLVLAKASPFGCFPMHFPFRPQPERRRIGSHLSWEVWETLSQCCWWYLCSGRKDHLHSGLCSWWTSSWCVLLGWWGNRPIHYKVNINICKKSLKYGFKCRRSIIILC